MNVRRRNADITRDMKSATPGRHCPESDLQSGRAAVDFCTLYRSHSRHIYELCLRYLGDQEDAEDATQEVFATAYRQLAIGSISPFAAKPWLYRVAVNGCIDVLRKREAGDSQSANAQAGIASCSPENGIDQWELRQLLVATLNDLPRHQRMAILNKYLRGLSHAEMAAHLGITCAASEMLLHRACAGFQRRVNRSEPSRADTSQLHEAGSASRCDVLVHLRRRWRS